MEIKVKFSKSDEELIRDGYYAKHGRRLDESIHVLSYYLISEYLQLGKKVRRRRVWNKFFDEWGAAMFWIAVILAIIIYSVYQGNQHKTQSNYNTPSHSTIYQADSCPVTTCTDGSCSDSVGRGTCSHHGGEM